MSITTTTGNQITIIGLKEEMPAVTDRVRTVTDKAEDRLRTEEECEQLHRRVCTTESVYEIRTLLSTREPNPYIL